MLKSFVSHIFLISYSTQCMYSSVGTAQNSQSENTGSISAGNSSDTKRKDNESKRSGRSNDANTNNKKSSSNSKSTTNNNKNSDGKTKSLSTDVRNRKLSLTYSLYSSTMTAWGDSMDTLPPTKSQVLMVRSCILKAPTVAYSTTVLPCVICQPCQLESTFGG